MTDYLDLTTEDWNQIKLLAGQLYNDNALDQDITKISVYAFISWAYSNGVQVDIVGRNKSDPLH